MSDLRLTLAVGDYDHMRDLALGRVRPVGIDLTVLNLPVEEIFFRFHDRLEFDAAELSMGMYCSALSRDAARFIAIPVFPSRVFRHSAIYVRADAGIARPEDLAGRRVGVPQWSQTATIWVRGYLSDTVGVPLAAIDWVQAGVDQAGRPEPSQLRLPPDIRLRAEPGRSLDQMLLEGEIDAAISARPPRSVREGDPRVRRLFPDYRAAEEDYFRRTRLFPIMHTIAIRRDTYEANRWIARNLMTAFEQAKQRSAERMLDVTVAHVPLPWIADHARSAGASLVFEDRPFWPYGLEHNRHELEAFLRYAAEQGVCHRLLRPEELFAPEAIAAVRV
jgi:4,5-dihydroxyphthalate decarboxylase